MPWAPSTRKKKKSSLWPALLKVGEAHRSSTRQWYRLEGGTSALVLRAWSGRLLQAVVVMFSAYQEEWDGQKWQLVRSTHLRSARRLSRGNMAWVVPRQHILTCLRFAGGAVGDFCDGWTLRPTNGLPSNPFLALLRSR
jgi:hypothetical protein